MKIFAAGKNKSQRRVQMMERASPSTHSSHAKNKRTAGNVFFALFAAVAMVGAVGFGFNTVLRGPMKTMTDVTRRTVAESTVVTSSRLAIVGATTQQDTPDCDADGYVEPMPYREPAVVTPALPRPVGGGYLPTGLLTDSIDPWKTEYGYCAWDSGSVKAAPACGGATGRLSGGPDNKQFAIAIISAGKDKQFQTTCNAFADTAPADGAPDTPLIVRAAGSDDILLGYTYAEANDLGSGMWKPDPVDPTTAETRNALEGTGTATIAQGVTLQGNVLTGGGLVLPDQTTTGSCDAVNDKQIRRNTTANPPTLEICNFSGGFTDWMALSGSSSGGAAQDCTGLGADHFNDPVTGHCYYRSGAALDWPSAKSACEANGAYLAAITSSTENGIVDTLIGGTDHHIGGTDSAVEGTWLWSNNGSNFWIGDAFGAAVGGAYTNWAGNEPFAGSAGSQQCLKFQSDGTWDDDFCSISREYVCEKDGSSGGGGGGGSTTGILVAHWKLDETSGTTAADEVGSSIGTLTNSPTWTVNGLDNGAVTFDTADQDHIRVPRSAVLEPTSLTVSMWIKRSGAQIPWAGLLAKRWQNSSPPHYESYVLQFADDSDDTLDFSVANSTGISGVSTTAKIPNQEWVHVAASYNPLASAGQIKIYVNGQLNAQATTSSDPIPYDTTNSGDLMLGSNGGGFSGAIDDVRIYNYSLSDTEVYSLYNAAKKSIYKSKVVGRKGQILSWGNNTSGSLGLGTSGGNFSWPRSVVDGDDFTQVEMNCNSGCGLKAGGTVWCWGDDAFGQLGNGTVTTTEQTEPVKVSNLTDVVQISGGCTHTCALKRDGTVWCWGEGLSGRLGNGDTSDRDIPTQVANITDVSFVAAGRGTSCAIRYNGEGYCWGRGVEGNLGNGANTDSSIPVPIANITDGWVKIDISNNLREQSCGITRTGLAYCWGEETNGSLGNGATGSSNVPSLVLNTTGTGTPNHFTDWMDISTTYENACGITGSGMMYCWGNDVKGAIGNGATTTNARTLPTLVASYVDWTKVTVGTQSVCGIRQNGEVHCWGAEDGTELGNGPVLNTFQTAPSRTPIINALDISALEQSVVALVDTSVRPVNRQGALDGKLSVGNLFVCAINDDGTAWCWGNDTYGQLGNGATTGDKDTPSRVSDTGPWMQIGSGTSHSCGIKTDGSLWCWGRDNNGQLGNGAVSADQPSPVAVTSTLPWSKISVRGNISCGIKVDGSAWCWGIGSGGAIGNGGGSDVNVPTQVSGGYVWTDIATEDSHTFGIQKDGSLWFWGAAAAGLLHGDLYPGGTNVPIKALDPGPWTRVFRKGQDVGCALKADGSLWCWGQQQFGTVGNGVSSAGIIYKPTRVIDPGPWLDFGSGGTASCGLKIDGSLWCWGTATNGVLGNGLTAGAFAYPVPVNAGNDWAAISTGNSRSCGIKQDRSIWCWGTDANGALGNGATVTSTQSRPYRVATLPIRSPWSISADGGGMNMRPGLIANIGTTRSISADGAANTGLNLSGSGRSILRTPTTGNQLLIAADGNQLSSQLSFKAPSAPSLNVLPPNPVAWYRLEETSGTTVVDSIAGNNGTWTGSPSVVSAAGRVGNGVDLPADTTYITMGDPAALRNLYPVTVSAWINPDATNCHTGFTSICNIIYSTDVDGPASGGWGFYMNPSRQLAVGQDSNGLQTITNQVIPTGTWTHVAASWAPPSAAKVYINGVEASYSNNTGMPWLDDTGTDKSIGGSTTTSSQTWNMDGKIDEVMIYGRILTPAEIAQIYSAPTSTAALMRTLGLDPLTGNFKISRNALGTEAWLQDLYTDLEISNAGEVGIGTSGAPQAKLDVKGAIQVGNDASACAAGLAGTMRWNGTNVQYCDGSAWGILYAGAIPWATGKDQFSAPCAIRADGTAWCWGNGALGNGTAYGTVSTVPVQVQTNTGPGAWSDWTKISSDACHTCGIRTNGTLWCWGSARDGQLGNGDWSTDQSRPVQVQTDTGPGGWSDWVEVSAGSGYDCYARTCGRRADGSAWCWGSTTGDGTDGARLRPTRIQTDTGPGAWNDWTKISSSTDLSCGLRSNGTLWCWGNNYNGSVGDGSPTSTIRYRPSQVVAENPIDPPYTDWVDVAGMGYKFCAKRASGSIWCWGHNGSGQLGRGWTVADETRPSIVVDDLAGPAGWYDWASLGVGGSTNHVGCGVRANGTAWCWGGDYNGQMGNGAGGGSGNAVQIVTDTGTGGWNDWVTISFVRDTTCGLRSNGSLWCWGAGAEGLLGNGGTTDQQQPVRVTGSP